MSKVSVRTFLTFFFLVLGFASIGLGQEKCLVCHTSILKSKDAKKHAPINVAACDVCHVGSDAERGGQDGHQGELANSGGSMMCLVCHTLTANEIQLDKYVHKVNGTGLTLCTSCHDPHASEHKMLLLASDESALCLQCHKDAKDAKVLHSPIQNGSCTGCHKPHSSSFPHLLRQTGNSLCISCHAKVSETMTAAGANLHEPAGEDCLLCHRAHGSDHENILVMATGPLCLDCHTDIEEVVTAAKVDHSPVVVDSPAQCVACHNPHASPEHALLHRPERDGCLFCHGSVQPVDNDGQLLTDVKARLENLKFHHAPLDNEENCSTCHKPHGSDYPRLLTGKYPKNFYTTQVGDYTKEYAFCFQCHNSELLTEILTTQTGFRDGERNLHYVHVVRTKGRSCRACHEMHATDQPHLINEQVPFAGWFYPLKYIPSENGGTCSAVCHAPYKYDRVHPIGNNQPDPINPAGSWPEVLDDK